MKNLCLNVAVSLCAFFSGSVYAADEVSDTWRMYRLNCGEVFVKDLNVFSDTDDYVGQNKKLVVSCYLLRRGEIVFLWDTGVPNAVAETPEGFEMGPFVPKLERTLQDQLSDIDLKPEDVTHVALSHAHFDHAGNIGMFSNAEFIVQKAEYDFISEVTKDAELAQTYGLSSDMFGGFLSADNQKVRQLSGDEDIFSDGTLVTIKLPGHTPGHMAIRVQLENSGAYILSGDQWHFDENREVNGVPSFNFDRADTLASSERLNRIVENRGATLVIQHEEKDVSLIPAFPLYID